MAAGTSPAKPRKRRTQNAKQRAAAAKNLKPAKKGEVRNPTGRNGWSRLNERLGETADKEGPAVYRKMLQLAKDGDVQAARLVLGPALVQQIEEEGIAKAVRTFADLVKASQS